MKAKDIIKRLETNYEPDEELIITFWDKDEFDARNVSDEEGDITPIQWREIVKYAERSDWWDQRATDGLMEIIETVLVELSMKQPSSTAFATWEEEQNEMAVLASRGALKEGLLAK